MLDDVGDTYYKLVSGESRPNKTGGSHIVETNKKLNMLKIHRISSWIKSDKNR